MSQLRIKTIEIMRASKVTIEFAFNNQAEWLTVKNTTVWNALKQLKKQFGEVIIYNIKTEY